jgi:hypothetical protein
LDGYSKKEEGQEEKKPVVPKTNFSVYDKIHIGRESNLRPNPYKSDALKRFDGEDCNNGGFIVRNRRDN